MNWYVAPVYKKAENGNFSYTIGHTIGDEIFEFFCSNYICHGYHPKNDPAYVLIGLKEDLSVIPSGWSKKTLDQAKEYFYNVYNIEATEKEIY